MEEKLFCVNAARVLGLDLSAIQEGDAPTTTMPDVYRGAK
jgi:hypothetical protein